MIKLLKLLGRGWLPLVVVAVVVVGVVVVAQVRTWFGGESAHLISTKGDDTEPFTPKFVTYEVDGDPGATADINYLDLDSRPQRVDRVALPWSVTLRTNLPGLFPSLLAQGTGSLIECRIRVDHEIRDQRTSTGFNAMTFCVVKSA